MAEEKRKARTASQFFHWIVRRASYWKPPLATSDMFLFIHLRCSQQLAGLEESKHNSMVDCYIH